MAPITNKRKETLIQIMRREVELGSAVNFLEERYQTNHVDVLQLTYHTLLEHKLCLDKLLDNISTLAERSGEIYKWFV